jgi:hypothetical protein
MNAALRVWWTFLTALPLQRWLGSVGAALCVLLALVGFVLNQPLWMAGLVVLLVLAVFPTLFAGPAVFRALSSPRANQLWPHFRARMLGATALFIATLLALFALLIWGAPSPAGRAPPLELIGYTFAIATALFFWMFLQLGDWRWVWLWIAGPLVAGMLGLLGLSPSAVRAVLTAIPPWAWPAAAVAIWLVFAVWYVRAGRIRPIMLVPQAHARAWARAELDEAVTRDVALRMLVTARPPRRKTGALALAIAIVVGTAIVVPSLTPAARFFSFTSFVWPFSTMMMLWGNATAIVHRSRLLWLRMPGSRDVVRREIERALLRNFRAAVLLLLAAAAVYASPLVAAPPREVLAGFALAACAGLFITYVAFAAVPGGKLQLVSCGLMIGIQMALLARPSPSLTSVAIVAGAELVAAIMFRAVAIRNWRHVDWSRLRPLPTSNMLRGA